MASDRVVILGGGPGGYEAALVAAQLGAEVTVVDSDGIVFMSQNDFEPVTISDLTVGAPPHGRFSYYTLAGSATGVGAACAGAGATATAGAAGATVVAGAAAGAATCGSSRSSSLSRASCAGVSRSSPVSCSCSGVSLRSMST